MNTRHLFRYDCIAGSRTGRGLRVIGRVSCGGLR